MHLKRSVSQCYVACNFIDLFKWLFGAVNKHLGLSIIFSIYLLTANKMLFYMSVKYQKQHHGQV